MNKISYRVRQLSIISILILAGLGFNSCEKYQFNPPAVDPDNEWSLATDIQPIFNSSCTSCHGGTVSPDLRATNSYNALTKGGYVQTPAESSRLYSKITNDPAHASRVTDTERLKILYWIQQGAKNN